MPALLKPESTVAILLGASDWTASGLGRARSFKRSANAIQKLLIESGRLGFEPHHVLNYFDSDLSADDQLSKLSTDLDEIIAQAAEEGVEIADALIYYIGHGSLKTDRSLTLLVRRSRKGLEEQTGLPVSDLAYVLRTSLRHQRYYVVLDCCFSESAAKEFVGMGPLDQAVAASAADKLSRSLPGRGGLLLCACPANEIAIGPPDAPMTTFSGALVEVLRDGDGQLPEELSFSDLRDAIADRLLRNLGKDAPRPVLHSVNQKEGDLSREPAFMNSAQRQRQQSGVGPAEMRRIMEEWWIERQEAERMKAVEAEAQRQEAERAKAAEAKAQAEREESERARAAEAKAHAEREEAERARVEARAQAEREEAERAKVEEAKARAEREWTERLTTNAEPGGILARKPYLLLLLLLLVVAAVITASVIINRPNYDYANNTMNVDENLTTDMNATDANAADMNATDMNATVNTTDTNVTTNNAM